MRKPVFLLIGLLCSFLQVRAFGQDPDSLYTNRVEKFNQHISITAHLTRIDFDSRLSNSGNRKHIDFKTATSTRLGFSFDYR